MKTIPQLPSTGQDHGFDKNGFQQEWTDILNWWSRHMVDEEHGGFYGQCDALGRIIPQADKGGGGPRPS